MATERYDAIVVGAGGMGRAALNVVAGLRSVGEVVVADFDFQLRMFSSARKRNKQLSRCCCFDPGSVF